MIAMFTSGSDYQHVYIYRSRDSKRWLVGPDKVERKQCWLYSNKVKGTVDPTDDGLFWTEIENSPEEKQEDPETRKAYSTEERSRPALKVLPA